MPQQYQTAKRAQRQDPDEGDSPVRLTSPRDWLVVLVVTAVVIGGAVWGTTAKLSRSVSAGGLITSPSGAFAVQTPVGGEVTDVLVRPGDRVERGNRLAQIVSGGVRTTVRSPTDGQVFSVPARVGEVMTPGSTVVNAERGRSNDALVAVLFLPATVPATLVVGSPVQLTVQSAPVNQYGVLRGRITWVDQVLSTRQEIAEFVGDPDLASALAGTAGGRRVVVGLDRSTTPSGYRWSTKEGPPFPVASRTVVLGNLPQPPARPIEWVVPQ
jgi:biotin carboxyl carrier protein